MLRDDAILCINQPNELEEIGPVPFDQVVGVAIGSLALTWWVLIGRLFTAPGQNIDDVVAGTALDPVIPSAAFQPVIAALAIENVVPRPPLIKLPAASPNRKSVPRRSQIDGVHQSGAASF